MRSLSHYSTMKGPLPRHLKGKYALEDTCGPWTLQSLFRWLQFLESERSMRWISRTLQHFSSSPAYCLITRRSRLDSSKLRTVSRCTLAYLLMHSKRGRSFLPTKRYSFLRNTTNSRIKITIVSWQEFKAMKLSAVRSWIWSIPESQCHNFSTRQWPSLISIWYSWVVTMVKVQVIALWHCISLIV